MSRRAIQAAVVIAILSGAGPAAAQPQTAQEKALQEQITELDAIIDVVSDVRNLNEAIHNVKEHVRVTDNIEALAGDPGAGLGFELRQMYGILENLDEGLGDTRVGRFSQLSGDIHEILSAVDAVSALLAGTHEETTPGQKLKLLGEYIGAMNDAIGLLGLAVNPVLDAMLAVYGRALVTAGEFADEVVAPRTAAINEAIDAAGDALGSGDGAGSSAVGAYDEVLDELMDMRAELVRKQTELENRPNPDVVRAQSVCLGNLGLTIEQVIDQENELTRAKHELMRLEAEIREAEGQIIANQSTIQDKKAELETQRDRQRRRIISAESRDPATVQAEIEALESNVAYARDKIRRLQEELRAKYPEWQEKLRGPQSYKDCLRSILTQYADDAIEDLPIQYRQCTFWNLPDRVRRAVAAANEARPTGGERVETGGPADEPAEEETGDPADGRVGQAPTGASLEGGGTGVAMVSMPGADLSPAVTPISFEINPRQLPEETGSFVSISSGLVNPVAILNGTRMAGVQLVFGEVPSQEVEGAAGGREVHRASARIYPGGSTEGPLADPEVEVYLTSLGQLGAGAIQMTVANAGPSPVTLGGGAVVLEPVALLPADRQAFDAASEGLPSGASGLIDAYCLDFLASPPDAGTVFRIAGAELQQRFAPLRGILDAGRRLQELGALSPDSDPAEYFHSIRQWAIWAELEGLDKASFGASFVEQVKQNFDQAGQPWDEQARGLVEGLVPNRWKDVASILEEARSMSTERKAGT